MVSPELLRRYRFFAGLSNNNLVSLAKVANDEKYEAGHLFFHEGSKLETFYLVLEGAISINISIPDPSVEQELSGQLTSSLITKDVTVSTVGTGDVFGWSALIPPTFSSAKAKAMTHCHVIAFDCTKLFRLFEQDCEFGYLMIQKAAQIIRDRLRDLQIESLAFIAKRELSGIPPQKTTAKN